MAEKKRKRVTTQDIADALQLSRNTVSKALNGNGLLADETRQRILLKARELGYKEAMYRMDAPESAVITADSGAGYDELWQRLAAQNKLEIALFTQNFPNQSHFAYPFIQQFQERLNRVRGKLSIFSLNGQSSLPPYFSADDYAAFLCVEMFDLELSRAILALQRPTLFADAHPDLDLSGQCADLLLMENRNVFETLCRSFIRSGETQFLFAGNRRHCRSFRERFDAFLLALTHAGLSPITDELSLDNGLGALPSVLSLLRRRTQDKNKKAVICAANDFIAIDIVRRVKAEAPDLLPFLLIIGFDDSYEAQIIEPNLTTVRIARDSMGKLAASLLLSRLKEPQMLSRSLYIESRIIYRDSAPCPSAVSCPEDHFPAYRS